MDEFPYDSIYDPPVPACKIAISTTITDRRINLAAIIDTGSDGTIIPVRYLQELGARRAFEAGLRSQWGERRIVFMYLVDLQIAELTLPGVYVVGDELGEEAILGRNVLNRLKLLLDGPAALMRLIDH